MDRIDERCALGDCFGRVVYQVRDHLLGGDVGLVAHGERREGCVGVLRDFKPKWRWSGWVAYDGRCVTDGNGRGTHDLQELRGEVGALGEVDDFGLNGTLGVSKLRTVGRKDASVNGVVEIALKCLHCELGGGCPYRHTEGVEDRLPTIV